MKNIDKALKNISIPKPSAALEQRILQVTEHPQKRGLMERLAEALSSPKSAAIGLTCCLLLLALNFPSSQGENFDILFVDTEFNEYELIDDEIIDEFVI